MTFNSLQDILDFRLRAYASPDEVRRGDSFAGTVLFVDGTQAIPANSANNVVDFTVFNTDYGSRKAPGFPVSTNASGEYVHPRGYDGLYIVTSLLDYAASDDNGLISGFIRVDDGSGVTKVVARNFNHLAGGSGNSNPLPLISPPFPLLAGNTLTVLTDSGNDGEEEILGAQGGPGSFLSVTRVGLL